MVVFCLLEEELALVVSVGFGKRGEPGAFVVSGGYLGLKILLA